MRESHPTFSFISAVYMVAPYLPEYLASLGALEGGHDDLEILFINNGSPDESEAIIEEWIASTGAPARVIRKEHGGSGSARNIGLDHARGRWVSFPDPDDVLDAHYLSAIREFLEGLDSSAADVAVLATKVVQFRDSPSTATDDHPLGFRYHQGPGCVRLADDPRFFHAHAPSGFYRRDVIERAALRLDERLSAAFEDAAFVAEYLLAFDDPIVGVVPDAVYAYRRRGDSVTGTMWSKPDRYTAIPEHGYLRLLRLRQEPPTWLQLLVLYDLVWYFHEYDQPGTPNHDIDETVAGVFLELLDQVLALIDEAAIYGYCLHPLPLRIRAALATRKTGRIPCREARVVADGPDALQISYYLVPDTDNAAPALITVDGTVRHPVDVAHRPIEYYGEVFLIERSIRVEAPGTIILFVNGEPWALTDDVGGSGARFRWDRPTTAVTGDAHVTNEPSRTRRGWWRTWPTRR